MTQEEKKMFLKDLCGRVPYGVICDRLGQPKLLRYVKPFSEFCLVLDRGEYMPAEYTIEDAKPYLRTKASMTDEEKETYRSLQADAWVGGGWVAFDTYRSIDYLNSIHVDFRGMIEKGLAIQVTPENNPYRQ